MKRLLVAAVFLFLAPVAMPVAASADQHAAVAPADQYFGRMKMSILGIRNYLKDLGQKANDHPEKSEDILHSVLLVDEAMHDWQSKYPRDPWIPKFAYNLAQIYRTLDTDEAQTLKNETMSWIMASYPTSPYAAMDP